MRKNENRILITLTIMLAFTVMIFGGTTLASTVFTEGNYYYELHDEYIVITGYFGSDTEITLPDKIAGYPVSVIGKGAFIDTGTVKVIHLPDTIMEIEEGAIAQGINVVYMSNTEEPIQSETDSQDSTGQNDKDTSKESDNDITATENPRGDNRNYTTAVDNNNDTDNDEKVAAEPHVEEAEISLSDSNGYEDNAEGIRTGDDKYTIRVDKEHHLIMEDSVKESKVNR